MLRALRELLVGAVISLVSFTLLLMSTPPAEDLATQLKLYVLVSALAGLFAGLAAHFEREANDAL